MQRFDFNLLVALDALLQEGSVRGAAERLNLTAPAVSHALGRLRGVMGDPILVRAGQRLVPTPRAIAVRDRVRKFVEAGQSILQDRPLEEVRDISRSFTVRANDSTISVFGSGLAERVQAEAPGIQIRFSGRSEEDVGPLRDGSVDLDIGVDADMGPEICTQLLLEDEFVSVVRSGHAMSRGPVTMQTYVAADHVVASRRGRPRGPIDAILGETGLVRRVPVIVPDALAAIAVAATSDYLATVPRSVAEWGRRSMMVDIIMLPFSISPILMFQSRHPRLEMDSAHRWLRECMLTTVQQAGKGRL